MTGISDVYVSVAVRRYTLRVGESEPRDGYQGSRAGRSDFHDVVGNAVCDVDVSAWIDCHARSAAHAEGVTSRSYDVSSAGRSDFDDSSVAPVGNVEIAYSIK